MRIRGENYNEMPDVPDPDFIGALAEMWFVLNWAPITLPIGGSIFETAALQTPFDEIKKQEQGLQNMMQSDLIVCRAHLAAFFWQVENLFEALRITIIRGQKEHEKLPYFWL